MKAYKLVSFALFTLFLTACGSNPQSYLKGKAKPIVNIEAEIASNMNVEAKIDQLSIENLTEQPLHVVYKLFWYDFNGVTQVGMTMQEDSRWTMLDLQSKAKQTLPLHKPTRESVNYRVYFKNP